MNIRSIAKPLRWQIENSAPVGGFITIAGWDFGGEGPIALLHHANGLCGASWAPVARLLSERYRVIAIDGRGHGDSDAVAVPDNCAWSYYVDDFVSVAQKIISEYGVSTIALGVGSSMGGIVAAAAQAQHGELFEQIIMLDPPIHPNPESAAATGYEFASYAGDDRSNLVEKTLRRRAVWPSRAAAKQAWQNKPLFAAWQAEAFELYLDEGLRDTADGEVELKCAVTVEAHIFGTTGSVDVMDYAPNVHVPVHFVHAANGFFDEGFFRGLVGLFPRAQFSQMSAGHMLPLEIPEQVAEFILDLPEVPDF